MYYNDNINVSQSTICQNCGEIIRWCDSDHVGGTPEDDQFTNVIDKLKNHINNDSVCIRERKLKQLFGEYEKLAQDHYLK